MTLLDERDTLLLPDAEAIEDLGECRTAHPLGKQGATVAVAGGFLTKKEGSAVTFGELRRVRRDLCGVEAALRQRVLAASSTRRA